MFECSASGQAPQAYSAKTIYWEGCNHITITQAWNFTSLTVFYMQALENAWVAL